MYEAIHHQGVQRVKVFIYWQDLIIEVIYADVIRGKLDQKNQQLEVDYAIGRDIQPEAVTEIISVLQSW